MGKAYGLTQSDRDGLRALIQRERAGKKAPSRRPVPTRRRPGGHERPRLIRGQSVGVQSSATILIDNVVNLAAGSDPSLGNPATQIEVLNRFSESFADNAEVWAIYSYEVSTGVNWETVKQTAGEEKLRIARALVDEASGVTAAATTFQVDNVVPIGNSQDPVGGNPATELTVSKGGANGLKEALTNNQPVTIFYNGTNWELLISERPRRIRGKAKGAYSSGGTFPIDDVVVLESGTDPRTDTTSATEEVTVTNTPINEYADNERVDAVWNADDGIWEALPKTGAGADIIIVKITGTITARSGATPGSGTVQRVDPDDFTVNIGSTFTAYSTAPRALSGATETVYCRATRIGPTKYFIDTLDPIWFMNYTGFPATTLTKILYTDGAGSANIKWGAEVCP